MSEYRRTFWEGIFGGSYRSEREEKALEYIVHRLGDGARLADIVREEYVRRNVTLEEVEDILANPGLVKAARREAEQDFASGIPVPWKHEC